MTNVNVNLKNTSTTMSNAAPTYEFINFQAIVDGYEKDDGFRFDFEGIFASVASYCYWNQIAEAKRHGIDMYNSQFVEEHIDDYCEDTEYIENRVRVALLKVIRFSVGLNTNMARRGFERFLIKVIKKNSDGLWELRDAQILAEEIATAYLDQVGVAITERRWNPAE